MKKFKASVFNLKGLRCPQCKNKTLFGYLYRNEFGDHQHTHYVCTYWPNGDTFGVGYRCGWHGWAVPSEQNYLEG